MEREEFGLKVSFAFIFVSNLIHICFKFDSYLFHILFTNVASRAIWRMQVKEWRGRSLASVTVVASSERLAIMGGGGLPISIFV